MDHQKISLLKERVKQINDETHCFIGQCKSTIQNSNRLKNDTSWLIEESLVLKEEALADKCKSLAIFKLVNDAGKSLDGRAKHISSIHDDTIIALEMLEEIKQTHISSTNPLHTLRTELLSLTFLP